MSGTPGLRIKASCLDQSSVTGSARTIFSLVASLRESALSSHAVTVLPPAVSACAAARPEAPSPNTAICWELRMLQGSSVSDLPQLQGCQAGEREDRRDDPEPDHDSRFGPAFLFEMMMQRRHSKYALAGDFEGRDLDDHGYRFQHE